ncbi:hypothetical protein Syun_019125 [Stephania yunnanensis]|uniref:RNase H type-1 domain-containing protein n=1 Tax=Stephania yunnanensis TaxID=152371 RepID=A0AAP0NWE1_9MAGN
MRDDQGIFVGASGESWEGVVNPKEAEAIGVREALTWVIERGIKAAIIQVDALSVVQAIYGKKRENSYFGSIIGD